MKLIAKMLNALERFTAPQASAPTETEVPHIAEAFPAINDEAPAVSTDKSSSQVKDEQQVTILLPYAGEDEKYLKVRVGNKILKVAKSRVLYLQNGEEVVITMTARYAASRPELAEPQ